MEIWRPDRELNSGARFCRPLRNHSAIRPFYYISISYLEIWMISLRTPVTRDIGSLPTSHPCFEATPDYPRLKSCLEQEFFQSAHSRHIGNLSLLDMKNEVFLLKFSSPISLMAFVAISTRATWRFLKRSLPSFSTSKTFITSPFSSIYRPKLVPPDGLEPPTY